MGKYLDLAKVVEATDACAKSTPATPEPGLKAFYPSRHNRSAELEKLEPDRLYEINELYEKRSGASAYEKNEKSIARAVILQVPDGVPEAWAQGVADLLVMPAPSAWPPARWATLQEDARVFLGKWGGQADRLGWTAHDLFSVHTEAPYARVDAMGLVPLLGSRRVVALCEESAAIEVSAGTQSFRRRKVWPLACSLVWVLGR